MSGSGSTNYIEGREVVCLIAPPPPIKTSTGQLKPAPASAARHLFGNNAVLVVRFNSKGSYALSGGQDRCLHLWNPHRGLHIKSYVGHGYEVLDIDVNYDNSKLASCGGDKMAYTWDVATGNIIRKLKGHTSKINSIRFNPEASVVVTASYDKTVKIFDMRSNGAMPIQELLDARDSVSSLHISDFEIIAGSVDGCVRTYDIRAGKLKTDTLGQPVTSVSLSNDSNCILVR
jgi:mitogen-activated protein kinase organizer 1